MVRWRYWWTMLAVAAGLGTSAQTVFGQSGESTPRPDPHVIVVPGAPPANPKMPEVIRPSGSSNQEGDTDEPAPVTIRPPAPPHPAGVSGTGFFIGRDGSLMTVAHVVTDCKTIAVVSRYLKETPAHLVARDPENDVAVLQAPEIRPPAVLGLAEPQNGDEALTLFGFPNDGDPLTPTQSPGRLRIQHPSFAGIDRPDLIWMDGNDVREGFSGGPVLNARGQAIGLISGHVVHRLTVAGMTLRDTKYVYGASKHMIDTFLNHDASMLVRDAGQIASSPDADKAVVHILCRH